MTATTPRLSEVARHLIIPEGIETSVFPRVQRRLLEVGVSFDRWQQGFGQVCLGCRSTGKYAASVGGVVASWPRQIGKALDLGTEILTANRGWTTMGEIRVGDEVFHPSGRRVAVTEVHAVLSGRDCFEVVTSDGRRVVADADHLWTVTDKRRERSVGVGRERTRWFETRTMTTREMVDEGLSRYVGGGRSSTLNGKKYRTDENRFQLPEQGVVDLPDALLPVDPYLLGAWLGDGSSAASRLASGDQDVAHWLEAIRAAGFIPRPRRDRACWDIGIGCEPGPGIQSRSFGGKLRRLGVLGNKHVPDRYLLGSGEQRLALLQGLLDADGSITSPRGLVEFCGTSKRLAEGVLFLARSLGWRAVLAEGRATIDGRDCGVKYRVTFTPKLSDGMVPFRLARKAARVGAVDGNKGRKTVSIKAINPVETRPVRCIKVASDDGLFLAGRDLVATHNTYTVGNITIGLCLEFPGFRAIWTSHHGRTTTNTFRSMQSMVRAGKIWPHVEAIRTANGEQEITFKNGSIIMFGAREQGFGRGMDKIDLEVFDEAQILGLKALEDMVPATNAARHPHGGLVVFIGTPPRPSDDGEAFTAKRAKALAGQTTDQFYCEISAEPDTDPEDRSRFVTFNPSYPHRTSLDAMLRMIENIPDLESRRREMLGIWPTDSHNEVVSRGRWKTLVDDGPPPDDVPTAFGVDMSHDRQISIAAAWAVENMVHVEEVWAGPSAAEAVDWLTNHARRRPIVIDNIGPAAALIPDLKAAKRNVVASTAGDMARACGMFEDRVNAGTLTHSDQDSISDALAAAKKRDIRDAGGWGWDRRDPAKPIYPLVAATLALLRASGRRRKPKGRVVVM